LINAVHLTGRKIEETKIVLNGAGAAGIACLRLMTSYGVKKDNIICFKQLLNMGIFVSFQ
jgi:malate dehydrogenase (oxaloacetate-decarboxylating)(NADP+)